MRTEHELLLHEMTDMLDGEHKLVDALQELENDSSYPQLKKAFAEHRGQTIGHVERLNQAFELLNEKPRDSECAGVKGLIEEKKMFMTENPTSDILDVFDVGAGIKAENYEICAYESMIDMAKDMKVPKVASLLQMNLKEEKAALKKLEGFSKKLKPNEVSSGMPGRRSGMSSQKMPRQNRTG